MLKCVKKFPINLSQNCPKNNDVQIFVKICSHQERIWAELVIESDLKPKSVFVKYSETPEDNVISGLYRRDFRWTVPNDTWILPGDWESDKDRYPNNICFTKAYPGYAQQFEIFYTITKLLDFLKMIF